MATEKPRILLQLEFEEAAQAYLHSLPPEHFMEATTQGTQRKITLESLDLVHVHRPDVQTFNELLVQHRRKGSSRLIQVVPDNMVVVWEEEIIADGSYDVLLQPCGPFCVMEYVSKSNKRKDYDKSFKKYERDLKVPYYLLFYPDNQELTLFHHGGRKYHTVRPNEHGRYPIPELEVEVAMLDGWVRFWFRGELLPLPADLLKQLKKEREARAALERKVAQLEKKNEGREALERENAQLRAQLARLQGQQNGK